MIANDQTRKWDTNRVHIKARDDTGSAGTCAHRPGGFSPVKRNAYRERRKVGLREGLFHRHRSWGDRTTHQDRDPGHSRMLRKVRKGATSHRNQPVYRWVPRGESVKEKLAGPHARCGARRRTWPRARSPACGGTPWWVRSCGPGPEIDPRGSVVALGVEMCAN